MYTGERTRIKLPSGNNVDMSIEMYNNYFINFTEPQFAGFCNFMDAELYNPQIMQFIAIIGTLLRGKTSFGEIMYSYAVSSAGYTILWFLLKLYKLPGFALLNCIIGTTVFRYKVHIIIIAIISLFIFEDWKILAFCLIGSIIGQLINSILCAKLSTTKYHDSVIRHVIEFIHK